MPKAPEHGQDGWASWLDRNAWWLAGCLVIAVLVGLAVWLLATGARIDTSGSRVRMTAKGLVVGAISLKMNEERDRSIALAARLTGQTQAGTSQFADPDGDFQAAGIKPGDTVFVLSGQSRGAREIAGVGPRTLMVKGSPFANAETGLAYLVRRADGQIWPELNIGRELDPANPGWTGVYAPRVNKRRLRYFTVPKERILNGQLVDLWGQPFVYAIQVTGGKIVEKIVCSGPDRRPGTPDDLEEVIAELPFGGG